jgi:ubiquinone biosynthesis protein
MYDLSTIKRMKDVINVISEYDLHPFKNLFSLRKNLFLNKNANFNTKSLNIKPEKLRKIFEKLGGAFIKFAQLLALRPDLVGSSYSKEFEKLLIDVPPENNIVIKKLVKHIPFTEFSIKPLGSASIAQVHKAVLNGKTVAVKIKRPNIEQKFSQDIKIMEIFAKHFKNKHNPTYVDPLDLVNEFKKYTEKELDFTHEAANMRKFARNFRNDKSIIVPKVYEEYSNKDILVMEFVDGKTITDLKKSPKNIIKKFTNSVYKMLFEHRFFHADLHPGNIFIKNKKIIFFDCGIVGYIDEVLEQKLFHLFSALVNGNLDRTANALLEINISNNEPDLQYLKDGLHDVLSDYYNQPLGKIDFTKIFYGSIEVARRSNIKIPAQLVLFGKSLVTMEGFCRQIDPNFNVVYDSKIYVNKFIKNKVSAKNLAKQSKDIIFQFYELITSFPEMIRGVSRKFELVESRIIDSDITFRKLTYVIWNVGKLLSLTLLFTTFLIVAIILKDIYPLYNGYSVYSILILVFNFFIFVEIIKSIRASDFNKA